MFSQLSLGYPDCRGARPSLHSASNVLEVELPLGFLGSWDIPLNQPQQMFQVPRLAKEDEPSPAPAECQSFGVSCFALPKLRENVVHFHRPWKIRILLKWGHSELSKYFDFFQGKRQFAHAIIYRPAHLNH